MIDIEYLRECFDYNQNTGELKKKKRPRQHFETDRAFAISNSKITDNPLTSVHLNGKGKKYIRASLRSNGKNTYYLAHRLAWAIHHGKWPEYIDHINGNGLDNRLCNLRDVTMTENNKNVRMHKTNTSGRVGVYRSYCGENRWSAYIWNGNKQINLGTFDSFEEASAARSGAEIMYGYHKNHGSKRSEND